MRPFFFLCFHLLLIIQGFSQDPYFSQFFANRVYLNPAYAGFDPGTTITLNYRNQWIGLPGGTLSSFNNSFETYNATVNFQIPCFLQSEDLNFGTAFSVFYDEAGEAPFQTTGLGWAFSLSFPLPNHSRNCRTPCSVS